MRGNIPSGAENHEVSQRDAGLFGFGGEHTEDGRIDMVFRDTTDVDEFFHCIFVRHVAGWNILVKILRQ